MGSNPFECTIKNEVIMLGIQDMLKELSEEMKLDISATPMIINKRTLVPITKFLVDYKTIPNFILNIETIQYWENEFGTKGMLKILKSLIRDAIIQAEMQAPSKPITNLFSEIPLPASEEPQICGFDMAWVGYCKEKTPCEKHKNLKCWKCGKRATRECDIGAGGFICGVPFCKDHPHTHGMW